MGFFLFYLGGLMMLSGLISRFIAARAYNRVAKEMFHREDGPESLSLIDRSLPWKELPRFLSIANSHEDPDVRKVAKRFLYGEPLAVIFWIAGFALFFLGIHLSN